MLYKPKIVLAVDGEEITFSGEFTTAEGFKVTIPETKTTASAIADYTSSNAPAQIKAKNNYTSVPSSRKNVNKLTNTIKLTKVD